VCNRREGSAEWVEWIRGVKIGKIFRQFSIKNADTSEQKSNFFKNFNLLSQIELRATSDEKQLNFRNKSAGSSYYRGSVFYSLSLPEFIPGCTYTALLPGSVCSLALEFIPENHYLGL